MSKHERYFFDIPIFRTDINKWTEEQKANEEVFIQRIIETSGYVTEKFAREHAKKWLHPQWSSYRYEEMVGMIRLYAMTQQIRGELWFVKQRITRNLKKKRWHYLGKLFEFSIFETDTNLEINERILKKLQEENKKGLLRNKYIDLEAFKTTGKYIDFLKLI
ncbi:MAG: hypothetical protein V1696_02780 [Candidatus Jorgensenbacteria bacterium]